jgi:hypothetical protein
MRLAALTLVLAALVVAATASRTAAHLTAAAACGTDYLPLKTFSDPLRKKVNLTPKDTTLAAITTPGQSTADADDTEHAVRASGVALVGADHQVQT